jgi:galactose-1-phosphate uridylyltransferase
MRNSAIVWEQRWHPLREEWVLYTSHRGGRPWLGEKKQPQTAAVSAYDPACALCPGNKRLNGQNPVYSGAYWFTNDLPCFGSPGKMKYLAGPEIGGGSMTNESDPDAKAAELQAVPNVLYRGRSVPSRLSW